MTGTLLNVITVLLGAAVGVLLGARFPERIRQTVMAGLGIMTLIVGVSMAIPGNALVVLFSLLVGGILGEVLELDGKLNALGRVLEARFARQSDAGNFTKGFVTASLVFCVGPMTILGSIQDGLLGDYRLLAIKSLLDMFAGLAFASTLGIGVGFAAITVLIVQGGIALAAMLVGASLGVVTPETPWIVQMTATGGAVIIGISLLLLDLKKIRIANFVPAILIAPLIQVALEYFKIQLP
jgi:uncharacterized membrane protein YqgA involved in biofilm formation